MLDYLLNSGACLALFFLFYKLLLERQHMNVFKRYYLLGALLVSLGIPLLTFTIYLEPASQLAPVLLESANGTVEPVPTDLDTLNLPLILWSIYGVGVALFSFRFVKNLLQLRRRIKHNPKQKVNRITQVLHTEPLVPHTFFNYVFLNREKFETRQIPREVMMHEEIHARQKHSLDILCIELVQLLFWFNPFIYLLKRAIKLNHEFLADSEVVQKGIEPAVYQKTILSFSSNTYQPVLANAINYSSIKKRFTVMKTKTSKRAIWIRSFLTLPLLALLLSSFSQKNYVQEPSAAIATHNHPIQEEKASTQVVAEYNSLAKAYNVVPLDPRKVRSEDLLRMGHIYALMTPVQRKTAEPLPTHVAPPVVPQEKATPAMVAEYNALAKKYNAMPKEHMRILGSEVERMRYIYDLMTAAQRQDAEPFPELPEPPPPPAPPLVDEVVVEVAPVISPSAQEVVYVRPTLAPEPEVNVVAPISPKSVRVLVDPSPPAPAKSPKDFIEEMAEKNAEFYHNGKKISASKALKIYREAKGLHLRARHTGLKRPIVELSSEPFDIIED
ncbi:M56 family metallopeptidase [Spongiimicrobium sp. 2-473A-2-J]|uniref:M56 family metallopeptidase n=1 Tax=Eudoraea algarum TaxID=3417568 RepID=UPI003D36985B